jgi:ribonuclease HI
MIEAYFDGCCEPVNPGGTASFGAVIFKSAAQVWSCSRLFYPKAGRERETSNNVAEYSGFIAILEYCLEQGWAGEKILIRGDSNLVIQQCFGTWKIRKGYYVPLAHKAIKLLRKFRRVTGEWIPREKNSIADELSKAELIKAGVEFRIQPLEKEKSF